MGASSWFVAVRASLWQSGSTASPRPLSCRAKPLRAAASPVILVAAVVALLSFLVPSHQARIDYALCPAARFVPSFASSTFPKECLHTATEAARVPHPVRRVALEAHITKLIARSGDFVVVEGAERMGKSTLVQNVSAALSASRTVRSINCSSSTTGELARVRRPLGFCRCVMPVACPESPRSDRRARQALHAARRLRD